MTLTADIYYPGQWFVGGAESYVLHLARSLRRAADVRILVTASFDQRTLREALRVEGQEVELVPLTNDTEAEVHRTSRSDLFFNCSAWAYIMPPRRAVSAMLIYYAPALRRHSITRGIAKRLLAKAGRVTQSMADPRSVVASYDRILCVSNWTGALVADRWNRNWDLLYPAVPPVTGPGPSQSAKDQLVLTVGRIGAGGTDKGHLAMAELFSRMAPAGWRMVVAGAINYSSAEAVAKSIVDRGLGMVTVAANPSRKDLEDLYRRAALYWHGAGMNAPDGAVGHEHFGISIVEAMSAGAVPLAHGSGGPVEILSGPLSAGLWKSETELKNASETLMADAQAMSRLGSEAISRAAAFSPQSFDRAVDALLQRMSR